MAISIIMDVILVGIIALCAYKGFRSGFITSVIGIIAVVVAIYGANLLAVTFSGEFVGFMEPFVSGIVDSVETKILSYEPEEEKAEETEGTEEEGSEEASKEKDASAEDSFVPAMPLSGDDLKDAVKVSTSILVQLGLSEEIADGIAQEVGKITDTVGARMTTSLTQKICEKLSFIAVFIISFALIMILFTAIGNVLDLVFGLPGLENINHILGGVLGAAKGIIIVVVICCFCRYLGIILDKEIVENTWIMSKLMENNFVANLLNI